MSVKIMGQVWDLDLPQNEKFVLLAYADHADHNGDNIFPAVATVAKKTGYSERSIQRTTRSLEEKGYLVANGKGPKGTNKWKYGRGDKLAGVTNEAEGVTSETERGDIALAPEPSLTTKEPSMAPNVAERKAATIEEAVFTGQPVTEDMLGEDVQFKSEAEDAAYLICQNNEHLRPLALAFMLSRRIILPIDKKKQTGHRKALKEMYETKPNRVRPEHITQAVQSLIEKSMTVTDLFAVIKTARDLANPPPEAQRAQTHALL